MEIAIVLFVVAVVVLIILGVAADRKRKAGLRALASRWGFAWSDRDPFDLGTYHARHSPLARGRNRYAHNVFHGERSGRRVICFDWHYETTSTGSKGKRRTNHHHFSAALVPLGATFPRLAVRPEGFLDRFAEFVGLDDIDFESAEFSRKYHVTSDDRRFAFDIFHARAMEYLLSGPPAPSMEFAGDTVLVHDSRRWDPVRFEAAVSRVEGLLALVPEYVWRSLGSVR